jgi:hypothetical protein
VELQQLVNPITPVRPNKADERRSPPIEPDGNLKTATLYRMPQSSISPSTLNSDSLFLLRMNWMRLEKIKKKFDFLEI